MIGHVVNLESLFRYESAHMLPAVPPGHKCGVMHGHSYQLTVVVRGPVRSDGFVIDFSEIKDAVNPLIKQLDHHTLNDIDGLSNPTVEAQLVWLWERLDSLPHLWELRLRETANNSASYFGPYE
jgi:6-pyruvoyltetrahydropterin/6-carboxytetrahydropterin synthase